MVTRKTYSNKTTLNLVVIANCAAILVVGKLALMGIPNVQVVTFLLIIYTLTLGFKKALLISIIFALIDALIVPGFLPVHVYIWPLIVIMAKWFKPIIKENFLGWAIFSGFFGIAFGFFSSLPMIFVGGYGFAVAYFLGGLFPFDIIHMTSNYFIMLLMGAIVYKQLNHLLDIVYNK